jgi:hypothetical protein
VAGVVGTVWSEEAAGIGVVVDAVEEVVVVFVFVVGVGRERLGVVEVFLVEGADSIRANFRVVFGHVLW